MVVKPKRPVAKPLHLRVGNVIRAPKISGVLVDCSKAAALEDCREQAMAVNVAVKPPCKPVTHVTQDAAVVVVCSLAAGTDAITTAVVKLLAASQLRSHVAAKKLVAVDEVVCSLAVATSVATIAVSQLLSHADAKTLVVADEVVCSLAVATSVQTIAASQLLSHADAKTMVVADEAVCSLAVATSVQTIAASQLLSLADAKTMAADVVAD